MDDVESRRFASTLVACIELAGNAAMDSRRPRPKRMEGGGAREIVTTEWRLPPDAGAGADDKVARKAASLIDVAVLPSAPCSDRRRT